MDRRLEELLGMSCGGPRCPHETVEDHWVLTKEEVIEIYELGQNSQPL